MTPEKYDYKFQYAVAACILELAKLYMYEFWYDNLLTHFSPDTPELIMTDTDSIVFSISCSNFMKKFKNLALMDFSNYPNDHVLYNDKFKMKLGYFKDEFPKHHFISEFIGLRAKLYCYRAQEPNGKYLDYVKAKGYNSRAAKKSDI